MKERNVLLMITPYSQPRMNGIARFAKEHRWNIMIADRLEKHENPESFDGVLMTLRNSPGMVATAKRIADCGVAAVDLTTERPDMPFARIAADNAAIGRAAAQHFAERGFMNYAWFSSHWSRVHEERFKGFAEALPRGATLAKWNSQTIRDELRAPALPVAVLAYNDVDAARLVISCRECGREVPADVAILGVGNDPFLCENQATTISSIGQNLEESAYRAAALLEKLMAMPPAKRKAPGRAPSILVPPAPIVERESSDTLAHPMPEIRAALVAIHKNLSHAFGAQEIAEKTGIPRTKLDRLFAEVLHRSVGAEILRQRLARAKRLLKNRDMLIKQIAFLCGFCNCAYLTNVFKEQTGLTPSQWRARES